MVTFNSDRFKEVNKNRTSGTWYHDQPSFFQIQFWAPYFSPPESNRRLRMPILLSQQDLDDVPCDDAPKILSVQEFDDFGKSVYRDWELVMARDEKLFSGGSKPLNSRYRQIVKNMVILSGPTWGDDSRLYRVLPWKIGSGDPFRVPVVRKSVSERFLGQPTVLLPTRENIIMLMEALQSFSGLEQKTIDYLVWAKKRLHNDGQYSIRSHLNAKKNASEVLSDQSPSLLQQFLSQNEPPERFVNVEPETEPGAALDEEEMDNEDDHVDEDEADDDEVDTNGNEVDLSDGLVSAEFI
ncbi:hypothetical protein MAJ_08877, partial [Metarhizium majus ARSEF 297]